MAPLDLRRLPDGRLVWTAPDGRRHEGVGIVRPFPLSAPQAGGCSIVDADGRELLWIEPDRRPDATVQALLDDALAARDFRPRIVRLVAVSSLSTPSRWQVETDRGPTAFVLGGEEQIRRLDGDRLLITSAEGVSFEIADRRALDRASRRLLERFL